MKPHSSSSSRKILSSCSSNNNSCSNGSSSSSSCCPSYVIPVSFVFFIVVLYGEDISCVLRQPFFQFGTLDTNQQRQELQDDIAFPFAVGKTPSGCNVFDGKWVYDEASRPQYEEEECPYIHAQLTCQKQGRPDKGYQHWRWQPHGCSLPSFNASMVLETIRGKRMLYVGDSLNRGQFVSMVCLLHRAIPDPKAKSFATNGSLTIFTAKEYGATVEFYWAPFLAESNSDDAIVHRVLDRIVRVGSVRKHAAYWKGADILVFNTYMWWMTGMKMKILRGPFTGDMKNIKRMETEDAYRVAMRGMVRWVEKNMDPTKTRVFFATMSPAHEKAAEWGGETGDNCLNETEPIGDPSYWGFSSSKSVMQVVVEELGRSRVPFTVLNITQLSDYRKDAHVSIYKKHWNPLTPEQIKNPRTYADCVHWCLPGLQDTWNELLFAKLFFP